MNKVEKNDFPGPHPFFRNELRFFMPFYVCAVDGAAEISGNRFNCHETPQIELKMTCWAPNMSGDFTFTEWRCED